MALSSLWGTFSGTTEQKLGLVNAAMVAGPTKDISADLISGILVRANKMTGLRTFVTVPGGASAATVQAATYFMMMVLGDRPVLPTSDPAFYARLQIWLAALVAATAQTGILQAHANAILSLAASTLPWWQAHGFTAPVGVLDLVDAGNLL